MLTRALEHEGESVALVLGLEGDRIIVARALEHLLDRLEVEAERQGAVAAVVLEAVIAHQERHERNVRSVHRLRETVAGLGSARRTGTGSSPDPGSVQP